MHANVKAPGFSASTSLVTGVRCTLCPGRQVDEGTDQPQHVPCGHSHAKVNSFGIFRRSTSLSHKDTCRSPGLQLEGLLEKWNVAKQRLRPGPNGGVLNSFSKNRLLV